MFTNEDCNVAFQCLPMPLRLSRIRFTPTFVPTIAALCALSVTIYLGQWQQARATEKETLQAQFDSRNAASPIVLGANITDPLAFRYTRAIARGEWLPSGQIFLDNKFDSDTVGFHVITPLKMEGTNRVVLVNRGWVARGTSYPVPPSVPVPQGLVTVEGVLVLPGTRFLELNQATIQGSVWQNLTIDRYRRVSGRDVLPYVLLEKGGATALIPVTERPDARAEKHVEYMLTWYSLAATVFVLWVALNLRLERFLVPQAIADKGNE